MELITQKEYIPEWRGNDKLPLDKQIKAKLTSLSIELLAQIEPVYDELCDEKRKLKKGKTYEFYNRVCRPAFQNENVELHNLIINGKEVTAEEAININKCLLLVMEIVDELISISYLSVEEEKNSEGVSGIS